MSHSLNREDSLSCHDLEGQNKVMTPDTKKPSEKNLVRLISYILFGYAYTFFIVGVIHHNVNSAKHLYTQTLSSL